ncbi:MAG: class I SAM-dependent methyltransferase [Pseudodesulfovibrio sp.]
MLKYQIESWISEEEAQSIQYSEYWNDEKLEKEKQVFYVEDQVDDLEKHVLETGLQADIESCAQRVSRESLMPVGGVWVDLAAGVLWAVPHLLKQFGLDKLICVEYSKHRLTKIGPQVLEYYAIPESCVSLVYGSFYELKLADDSIDFVFMAQAFHHAEDPMRLLAEIKRVLKPGGVVVIVGEHVVNVCRAYVRNFVKVALYHLLPFTVQKLIFGKKITSFPFFPTVQEFFPPDTELGDHYYSRGQYRRMFSQYGFSFSRIRGQCDGMQSFVLKG